MNKQNELQTETRIFCDINDKPALFAADELKKVLSGLNHTVNIAGFETLRHQDEETNRVILATRHDSLAFASQSQISLESLPCTVPQSYSIRKTKHGKSSTWTIIGFDSAGVMTGGLDFAQAAAADALESVEACDKQPYIKQRGIKFNIPLDARTPSYSDSGDSAQDNIVHMWEMDFWTEFLDEMARNRFNVLSLWSLHPFPSLVKVPEYPNAALSDVMKTSTLLESELEGRGMSTAESLQNLQTLKVMAIDEKIRFWLAVMQYAADRGIDVYIFTWNMFIYGTEHSGYPFKNSLADKTTADYFRKSVKALIQTYPLLKGIGITAGENMNKNADEDEAWLFDTYGRGINDALAMDQNRTFRLIHRIQYANIPKALQAFADLNPRCTIDTSFKYSQAHVYASVKPGYIHDRGDTYLQDIQNHKTWLTVRDDDYYMFRGGSDTAFIRAYIKNMPYEKLRGFYLGPDGYNWGREYISKNAGNPRQLVIRKRWYSFLIWGRLAYDPDLSDDLFIKILQARFPGVDAQKLFDAWACASRVIPLVNRFHNSGCQMDFQWYPEACAGYRGFHDINQFIQTKPQDKEGIMSIPEYADALMNNANMTGKTPLDIARSLRELANQVFENLGHVSAEEGELEQTIKDIIAMALLGKYYSRKIAGATRRWLSHKEADPASKRKYWQESVVNLQDASGFWKEYAEIVSEQYKPQALTRLIPDRTVTPDLPRKTDISYQQKGVDADISREVDWKSIE